MKVGDLVRLWRLEEDHITRTPTNHVGIVYALSNWTVDVFVSMTSIEHSGRFHPNALEVLSEGSKK